MARIKCLQRRIYDILSSRSLIALVALFFVIILAAFHFFEFYLLSGNTSESCGGLCCQNIGGECPRCEPIDAVYTWVNGSDPSLLQSMQQYGGDSNDLAPSRYDDKQELRYSLRSLEKYAPWIRHVYVVTAGQLPWWLDVRFSHVTLIDHKEIIPKEFLPTFSSPAIECFLHKIPGLSERFLYLNDDVFLGAPLELSELYSAGEGYSVLTAWNVPDCAQGCPWSFLGDSSCDQPCNNEECDFDGGDCLGDPKHINYGGGNHIEYLDDYPDSAFFGDEDKVDYGALGKYPGLDDPILEPNILQARQIEDQKLLNSILDRKKRNTLKGDRGYDYAEDQDLNLETESRRGVRKSMRSLQSLQPVPGKALEAYSSEKKELFLNSSHKESNESTTMKVAAQNVYQKATGVFSKLVKESHNKVNLSKVVHHFNKSYIKTDKRKRKRKNTSEIMKTGNMGERAKVMDNRNLDLYAKSLIYTNKAFNKVYGFQNRKVPAHAPFLLEKGLIEKMHAKFRDQIEVTKKNKFRRANDFQFAFAYYHFLMSEREEMTAEEVFDIYDTDKSGTWSDREVRTVLARVRGLPLTVSAVHALENTARACDKEEYRIHPTPHNERYLDSDMPTLTRALVANCAGIWDPMKAALALKPVRARPRPAATHTAFAMLSSNVTRAVAKLDEIRRDTKKFICINDNLEPSREDENEIVRMLLQELYEALLPLPSRFELPPGVANRFLLLSELEAWRAERRTAWALLSLFAILLLLACLYRTYLCRIISKIYSNV